MTFNRITLLLLITTLSPCIFLGCYSVVTCDGGYCGVVHAKSTDMPKRPAKDIESVKLYRIHEPLPAGARPVGTFTWSVTLLDGILSGFECPEEVEGFFRAKAANLGYDGVAGVQIVTSASGEKPNMMILDANNGVYMSQGVFGKEQNSLAGGAPVAMFASVPPFGSCVGVPYVIE